VKLTKITPSLAIAGLLAVLGGIALAAPDRYALQVPGGLAFSEFRGYEDWQTIAVSHNGDKLATILGNSRDDRGLQGGLSRQRQAGPRRRQDGEDPLDSEEE
jgi:hypothetical protein